MSVLMVENQQKDIEEIMNLEQQIEYSDNLTDLCLDDLDDLEFDNQSNLNINNNDKSQFSNIEFLQEK